MSESAIQGLYYTDPYTAPYVRIRNLTSESAIQGAPLIHQLVQSAQGRIGIMAGAGVTETNASELIISTGVSEVHASGA